jgi:hypothetical protein
MDKCEGMADFSLLGGPLHRLGSRAGLVRGGTDTIPLGVVLGVLPWIALVALALAEGFGHVLFSIEAIGAHVRLLVAIPLLFMCESFIDPRFSAFVHGIVRSRVVTETARPALESETARSNRWRDAWLPETLLLAAAVLLAFSLPSENFFSHLSGISAGSNSSAVSETAWTSQWYWMVCMTLFRFLFLRWAWRLTLWCFFLWRVSRLALRLVPIHPDRAGGIGYLEVVHTEFMPLVAAISAVQSASLAQEIAAGRLTLDAIYPGVALTLLADALLFIGPMCVFYRKLWKCKVNGLSNYGVFAERYVNEFDRKWVGAGVAQDEQLLGTADIQSLADLSSSVDLVRDMRLIPVSTSMLMQLGGAALLPLLPLVLFKYPLADLLGKFVEYLAGV